MILQFSDIAILLSHWRRLIVSVVWIAAAVIIGWLGYRTKFFLVSRFDRHPGNLTRLVFTGCGAPLRLVMPVYDIHPALRDCDCQSLPAWS